ncbi:hypothetical protein F2Q68_00046102 [Brassica cretica]|uniref:Uncharacterized protein n=1 Tax=Brassica cretica TaxID=69181 RepID=A0A8S9LPX8_BRACR|nr:hypothetical protein F2Q68_00046102 [Brassica cretica]
MALYSFLDKAAIVTEQDNLKPGQIPNPWRLTTVHRVEELKSVIRMGPIGASGILLITAYAQQGTFSLQQAKTMNRHLTKSFQIPAGSMSVFTTVAMLSTIVFYDRVFVKIARKFTGLERGITFLHRMGIGFVISIIATLVAGFVEIKRKRVAIEHGLLDKPHTMVPISFLWLVPQYSLHGIAEAFMSIGHLEFFYDQAPESMRSTATALFWMAISIGNYVSTLLVTLVHRFSAKPDGSNWLPDNNLNRGRLEYFYWVITVLQAVNLVYYLWCAKIYTYKPVQKLRRRMRKRNSFMSQSRSKRMLHIQLLVWVLEMQHHELGGKMMIIVLRVYLIWPSILVFRSLTSVSALCRYPLHVLFVMKTWSLRIHVSSHVRAGSGSDFSATRLLAMEMGVVLDAGNHMNGS